MKNKTSIENHVFEYLLFSIHLGMFHAMFPGNYQRRNIPVRNLKDIS